ncbi:MAG TPA: hypothetical protein VK702_04175 [Candidatus Acidoferrum sp.]|jgi:hypothetical protein|nr:hypothetical protein [Candidatus Acidoferrum sp.]
MEQTVIHMAEAAAWVFVVIFVFAIIGVWATIRWIINMVTAGERAVESGVHGVQDKFTHHE